MKCSSCDKELNDNNVHWAFDEPYCEDCFDDQFNYCCRCDTVISSGSTHYQDGDPYCEDCYPDDYDYDAPENPDVTEGDRDYIIHLSRSWLEGKLEFRRLVNINEKDIHLKSIRDKVGLVERPVYLFGLLDRKEYQISASQNIIEDVREFILLNLSKVEVTQGIGCNRLGISLSLRENNRNDIISLIKQISKVKEPVPAE